MKYLKPHYVPCVCMSRDYLIGFLDSLYTLSSMVDFSFSPYILDSARLTEYLPDHSKRSDRTDEEIIEIMKEAKEAIQIKENEKEDDVPEETYFDVHCSCGNYFAFYYPDEIPENGLQCDICGKTLIDFTNHHDLEFEYSGDEERMSVGMVSEKENEKEEDPDEEQD